VDYRSHFPLSNKQTIKGTRHLAREKTLQVLATLMFDFSNATMVFQHVFFRQFTFDAKELEEQGKILRQDEVHELEADVAIEWSQEDIDYASTVLREADARHVEHNQRIEQHLKNWEIARVALIDKMLLCLAMAEMRSCSDIPIKVTLNEIIELSKRYSTDKSGVFINGVLDSVVVAMQNEGLIKKSGRGLVEE
jgi:transcription antitermination factor NusB